MQFSLDQFFFAPLHQSFRSRVGFFPSLKQMDLSGCLFDCADPPPPVMMSLLVSKVAFVLVFCTSGPLCFHASLLMESSLSSPSFVLQQIIVSNDNGCCLCLLKEGKYRALKGLRDSSDWFLGSQCQSDECGLAWARGCQPKGCCLEKRRQLFYFGGGTVSLQFLEVIAAIVPHENSSAA